MADVNIISSDGRKAVIDDSELQAALTQGFTVAPNSAPTEPQPQKRSVPIWESALRAMGSVYEGAAGRGKFIISPVTGAMIPVDPEFENRFAEEQQLATEAAEANPTTDFLAGMASPEGLAASAATSGFGGAIRGAISNRLKGKLLPEAISKVQAMVATAAKRGVPTRGAMEFAEDIASEAAEKRLGLGNAWKAAKPFLGNVAGEEIGAQVGGPYGRGFGALLGGALAGGPARGMSLAMSPVTNAVAMIRDPAVRAAVAKLLMNQVTGGAAGSELDNLLRENQ